MYYIEEDIDFKIIDGSGFEELCYDLLVRMGFHSAKWKQGGPDNGRDIECYFTVSNPVLGFYDDKWFIECKNHANAISVNDLSTKLAWANAEKPNHLLIITSSYLSKSSFEWLEKMKENASYRIHVVEGKRLKELLLGYEDLIAKYFLNMTSKMLLNDEKMWIHYGVLPSAGSLCIINDALIAKNIKPNIKDYVFLWMSYIFCDNNIGRYCYLNNRAFFNFEYFFQVLKDNTNTTSILHSCDICNVASLGIGEITEHSNYTNIIRCKLLVKTNFEKVDALYSIISNNSGEGIEVILKRDNDLTFNIAYFQNSVNEIFNERFDYFKTLQVC